MPAERASTIDWKDSAAYAPLLDADRSLFAWEWLRRDPLYRAALASAPLPRDCSGRSVHPRQFGLVTFEPPDLTVPDARPVWHSDIHPLVLNAEPARPLSSADLLDLKRFPDLARIISVGGSEHLLLSDGVRTIRLDGPRGAFTGSPVCLAYNLPGLASVQAPLLTLRRFLALCQTSRFARCLHRREARARRWILTLRAWDAITAGASQRDIAAVLLSPFLSEPRWRSREPSIRSQVQRLVRGGRHMAVGGYRDLLRLA